MTLLSEAASKLTYKSHHFAAAAIRTEYQEKMPAQRQGLQFVGRATASECKNAKMNIYRPPT